MKRLYLDCDGVLADMSKGFTNKFNMSITSYEAVHGTKRLWSAIRNDLNFFGTLPLIEDAMELYDGVKHLRPIILTGVPFGQWAEHQKFKWRDSQFPGVPMVTCLSKNKRDYCQPGDIIIDDMAKHKAAWERAGGSFIIHNTAKQSLEDLKELW